MTRLEKLMKTLPDGADCALITSEVNRRYFSGMKSSAGTLAVFREKAYLIIDFRYYEKACATVKVCEVILQEKLSEQLKDLFAKHGAKTAAVDSQNMTLFELSRFKKLLPAVEFDISDALSDGITALRGIKAPDEIEKICKAQRIAEKAFENALNFIKPGITERELALMLDYCMLESGAEAISFDTIALFGKNSSLPHGVPLEKTLADGEFILMDFGAVYEGYHSDMTRTVCLGKPDDEMRKVYAIVLEAQRAALNGAKAGIKGSELDKLARDVIAANGCGKEFGHSLGHGVGMEIHEFPTASPISQTVLQENMVVTVEPGIYLSGKFGVRIEDFVVIRADGCDNLTKAPKELLCL